MTTNGQFIDVLSRCHVCQALGTSYRVWPLPEVRLLREVVGLLMEVGLLPVAMIGLGLLRHNARMLPIPGPISTLKVMQLEERIVVRHS